MLTDAIFDTTLIGTAGDDRLDGSDLRDLIQGLAGDDVLQGFGGADLLEGQGGDDNLSGGSGDDTLKGGGGHDTMLGGSGEDLIWAQDSHDDVVDGGSGHDTLSFAKASHGVIGGILYAGIETLIGSAFNDQLELVGSGVVMGGDGDDEIFSGANPSVAGRLHGQAGDDVLVAEGIADTLSGGAGDDQLISEFGDGAVMKGGRGDDSLDSHQADSVDGGAGDDTVLIRSNGAVITGGDGADSFGYEMTYNPDLAPSLVTDLTNDDFIDFSVFGGSVTIVDHFTHHSGQVQLVYDAGRDLTLVQMDSDGDGHADRELDLAGDHRDFTNFVL